MLNTSVSYSLADQLGQVLLRRNIRCVVAESCTGGQVAAAITDVAGSSAWFDRGFVTYSNESKQQMLGVPGTLIVTHGAVSEEVVRAMAAGALAASDAEVSVAISGVAGPDGGSAEKPVGTVWFAWAGYLLPTHTECHVFTGDRLAVREQAVNVALKGLTRAAEEVKQRV